MSTPDLTPEQEAHAQELAQTMLKGGFSSQKSNLLSASADNPSVTKTYHNQQAGNLRFVLGFENRGARMKLTVVSPNGKKAEARERAGAASCSLGNRRYPPAMMIAPARLRVGPGAYRPSGQAVDRREAP